MITQIPKAPTISKKLVNDINTLIPFNGSQWSSKDNSIKFKVDAFKVSLKAKLIKTQKNKCAYCGLTLEETSRIEIEHIAPKGGASRIKHPEFMFTINNLVLSCNFCNSPSKKGFKETIDVKDADYNKCTFKIVHPYFDDPTQHYSWVENDFAILIQGNSPKGIRSIAMFQLDSSAQSIARAKQVIFENYSKASKNDVKLVQKIINYK